MLRVMGLALPAVVLAASFIMPRQTGFPPSFIIVNTGLLVGLVLVDQTAPSRSAPVWKKLAWIAAELVLCFFIVRVQGSLTRPSLIYLLPASRAVLLMGETAGIIASLSVWVSYAVNIGLVVWPDRLIEYRNYTLFLLAPYLLTTILTLAALRQERLRQSVQGLYDELREAHEEMKLLHQLVVLARMTLMSFL